MAAGHGYYEVVEFLFTKGANIESKDVQGHTPLHLASHIYGSLGVVGFLVENGSNIESKDVKGRTPLHKATMSGFFEIARLLVKKGANIECKDFHGLTPLEWAVIRNNLEFVKLLRERKERLLKEYISSKKIQYFFRIITAKNVANRLRVEPDNLFDPEFSGRRKIILKIDDSRFI